jgi:hypothetical protein
MSGHAVVGLDEAAHQAEADTSSGVGVVVVECHSRHISVELPQVAVAGTEASGSCERKD